MPEQKKQVLIHDNIGRAGGIMQKLRENVEKVNAGQTDRPRDRETRRRTDEMRARDFKNPSWPTDMAGVCYISSVYAEYRPKHIAFNVGFVDCDLDSAYFVVLTNACSTIQPKVCRQVVNRVNRTKSRALG